MVSEFFYPQPGGISEHIRALSRELRLRGHEVTVITGHIRGKVDERDPRVVRIGRSQPIRYNGAVSRFTWGRRLRRKMRAALEEGGFDVLHVHNPHQPILPLVALSQVRCPAVGTFHSNNPGDLGTALLHPLMRPLVDRLDLRLAVSPTARRAASRRSRPCMSGVGRTPQAARMVGTRSTSATKKPFSASDRLRSDTTAPSKTYPLWLLLPIPCSSAIQAFGPTGKPHALPNPKRQRKTTQRASTQSLIQHLRREAWAQYIDFSGFAARCAPATKPQKYKPNLESALFYSVS